MSTAKPVVVYLHRYPPETEALQWPAFLPFAEKLASSYELVYICMAPPDGRRRDDVRCMMRVVELPLTVDQANGWDKQRKTLCWYWSLRRLLAMIREINPAVVICKETLPFIPGSVVQLGYPTIIGTSDWWWSIFLGGSSVGRWLADCLEAFEVRSWSRPRVRGVVSTHAEAKLLARRGFAAERIVMINAPQNTNVFRPLDPRPSKTDLGLDEHAKHVAICGIIRRGKGYDQLLDWWKFAVQRHRDWRLVIIGGAGGESWCRREIARRRLEPYVHMTGWLPTKEEVNRWLNGMDALLAHRRNSPDNQGIIPSALYNAMSTGRPVVATGLPGMAEIVRDGVDGFLFTPDDGGSFIAAIERVFADPVAAASIGKAALARASECFNPQNAADAHVALINSLVTT